MAQKKAYWRDFFLWIQEKHPDVENMRDVRRNHAEEYISLLRNSGSFQYVKEQRETAEKARVAGCQEPKFEPQAFSPATVNVRHKTIKAVFTWLAADAGITENPFNIQFLDNQYESRDAFTPDELKLIGSRLDQEPFVKPIFLIGICTGMSEGDICNLRWQDIRNGWIIRKRHKTGAQLEIPVLLPLAVFLEEQRQKSGDQDCVLPEHAQMYGQNPTGVTYRVKQFLEKLGIRTTRIVNGRARASSVKDVHSLRHTFAYMAGVYNIPLPIVQSVLGHMSPEMTKHYQAHADREAKQKYLAQMDNILGVAEITMEPDTAPERETMKKLAETLAIDKVRAILAFAAKL